MPRSKPGPFGRIASLNRLCRSALVIDGLLATGRRWEDIEREVAQQQYAARGFAAPTRDVVRRYFSLEFAPGLDPGYRSPLSYPAALALQYPEVRPMAVAPLLDLLFGIDSPKADQVARKQRFNDEVIAARVKHGEQDTADFMRLLNHVAVGRGRGRPSESSERPLWSLYRTMMLARWDLLGSIFVRYENGYSRRIRDVEHEVADLMKVGHIDALALLYGLVRESLEFTDHHRLATAVEATLAWLPKLFHLPECRRIAPLLARAVLRACDQAVPKRFSRELAFDRVRPGTWRDPGPLTSIEDLVFRVPQAEDSLNFSTLRELDTESMRARIEQEAQQWEQARSVVRRSARVAATELAGADFPFPEAWATPLKHLTDLVRESLPSVKCWDQSRFWAIQHRARCAICATGQESFPVMLVDFGHLHGDPVTDRPIAAVPWIEAERLWVEGFAAVPDTSQAVIEFLKPG